MLCQNFANLNLIDNYSLTPLHWASKHNNEKVVQVLCKFGANLEVIDNNKNSPLHWAVKNKNT